MERRQKFRGSAFSAAPIQEAEEGHQEKGLRITSDKKKSRRMRDDGESANKLEKRRDMPAITEEKKITPESKGCGLSRDEQCVVSIYVQAIMEQRREERISREERHIGDFHHLRTNRRNRRAVPAVHNIGEPIAIVLDEGVVTRGKGALRSQEHD